MKRFFGNACLCFCLFANPASAGIWQVWEDFETANTSRIPWFAGPDAGFDFDKGVEHAGRGNAWVRNRHGWSAINHFATPPRSDNCKAQAWIRFSDNAKDAYFSVRSSDGTHVGPVVSEVGPLSGANAAKNPENGNYNPYSFEFSSTGGPMLFYAGKYGDGNDSWMQIDDIVIQCRTPW